jgi:hypothetical protein
VILRIGLQRERPIRADCHAGWVAETRGRPYAVGTASAVCASDSAQ